MHITALGNGSGALTLATGGKLAIGDSSAAVEDLLRLQAPLFTSGFARYDIASHAGLTVEEGTLLHVERPGIRLAAGAQNALAREQALEAWTQPLYTADPGNGRVTQRGGASLVLRAGHLLSAADLRVGTGAGSGLIPARRSSCSVRVT